MEDDMSGVEALVGLDACAHWMVALLFILIGAVVVRKAHPTAGTLFTTGGVAHLLASCCNTLPQVWYHVDVDLYLTGGAFALLLATAVQTIAGALLIASFVVLARHVVAQQALAAGGVS
ncbi:MAG: hypothetical protein AB8I08_19315 [Sandaracinaceae bacterium]